MAQDTAISWCDDTLNIWWGCEKVAQTCKNCYAATLANRYYKDLDLWKVGGARMLVKSWRKNLNSFARLAEKTGTIRDVFVMSMGDIFEEDRPLIDGKGTVVGSTLQERWEFFELIPSFQGKLRFLLLTQRPENINDILPEWWKANPPKNAAIGCSVGNQQEADTFIPRLLQTPAYQHFVSIEPILGPIDLIGRDMSRKGGNYLDGRYYDRSRCAWDNYPSELSWVIAGGESGQKARPNSAEWIDQLARDCKYKGVAFHFKQWGKPDFNPDPNDPTMDGHGGYSLNGITYRDRLPA
jgi:protein gp37